MPRHLFFIVSPPTLLVPHDIDTVLVAHCSSCTHEAFRRPARCRWRASPTAQKVNVLATQVVARPRYARCFITIFDDATLKMLSTDAIDFQALDYHTARRTLNFFTSTLDDGAFIAGRRQNILLRTQTAFELFFSRFHGISHSR